ncbi:MAG: DUF3592 domain-containing protein [Acidobacteriota bacterium]
MNVRLSILSVGLLCMLALAGMGVKEIRAAQAAESWPTVPGKILTSEARAGEECVTFSYATAEGQDRTAHMVAVGEESVRYGENGERTYSCLQDVVLRYPVGTAVRVFYDPRNPSYAVLEPAPNFSTYVFFFVGSLFSLLISYLLWNEIGARIHIPGKVPSFAGEALTAPIGDFALSPLVTPSEVVAIYATQFASQTLAGNIRVITGDAKVSAQDLLRAELKAAILAHEKAGTIRLELTDSLKPTLYAVLQESSFLWPTPSTEARLEFPGREALSQAIVRWLAQPSYYAWARGAEKAYIPLVLRQAARVVQTGQVRKYRLADQAVEAAAAQNLPVVRGLLQSCQMERPQIWDALDASISKALEDSISKATTASENPPSPELQRDPWCEEAPSDVKSVPGLKLLGEVGVSMSQSLFMGFILWSAFVIAFWAPSLRIVGIAGLVFSALVLAVVRKSGWERLQPWVARWPKLQPLVAMYVGCPMSTAVATVVPLGALIIGLIYANRGDPRMIVAILAAPIVGVWWLLKRKAGEAITEHVFGNKSARLPLPLGALSGSTEVGAPPLTPAKPLPFEVEIIKAQDLPRVSQDVSARLEAIRERGPKLRSLYHRMGWVLAAGSILVALLAWQLLQTDFPWFSTLMLLPPVLVFMAFRADNPVLGPALLIVQATLRYIRGGEAQERNRWQQAITPIRPFLAPLFCVSVALFTALRALTYLSSPSPFKWIPIGLSAALVAWFGFYLLSRSKALQLQYPVYPPLKLLVLRVFGSANRDHFVDLLDLWHWFGPLYKLDGPDSVGSKSSDVVSFSSRPLGLGRD